MKKIKKLPIILGLALSLSASSIEGAGVELLKYGSQEKIQLGAGPLILPSRVEEKEEEFRGVWVSSVYNLDLPSRKGLSQQEFQGEYLELLARLEDLNLNTVIYQIRPKGDAFYPSSLNPWSEYLTGQEGKSPNWDPLKWMIEETHKRGMEFQAWFNPYRVTVSKNTQDSKEVQLSQLSPGNWARKNPDSVFLYQGKLYLNPGDKKVINHVNDTIMEVVTKYDVDGIHLDDYFYPNKRQNIEEFYGLEEAISYGATQGQGQTVSQWRRDNVNSLVRTISDNIRAYNLREHKQVEFGISPFGIWGHRLDHPQGSPEGVGSNTPKSSLASYDNQFADSRKWIKEGWVDYIAPQIYWTFDEKAAPYGELVNWWADQVRGSDVKLYIGHANYKKKENTKPSSWSNEREISNQLKFNQNYGEIQGSAFFRYGSLVGQAGQHPNDKFIKILREEHYRKKARVPKRGNKPLTGPREDLGQEVDFVLKKTGEGNKLIWLDLDGEAVQGYNIYRKNLATGKRDYLGRVNKERHTKIKTFLDREGGQQGFSYIIEPS